MLDSRGPLQLASLVAVLLLNSTAAALDLDQANALYKAGRWVAAAEAYEALLPELQGAARAEVLLNYGYCYERQFKSERAAEIYREVVATEGVKPVHQASGLLRLGNMLRRLEQSKEAFEVFEQAAKLPGASPDTIAQARLSAAWEHGTLEQYDAALENFQHVAEIPDVHENYIATALLSMARTYQRIGEIDKALAALKPIEDLRVVAATNRARARVYRLELEALLEGDTPFHIRPYVTKVTGTTAKLMWVSQGDAPAGTAHVSIGGEERTFAPDSAALKDTICHLQTVELDGLSPGQRYEYRVQAGDETETGSFRAAQPAGTPFSFAVIGDTQSYHRPLQVLLDRMAKEPTDFILHLGDVTDRGDLWGEWKGSFFDPGHAYLNKNVFWTVYGNHDGGPYFPQLFDMPGSHMWHSFDWGDVHFVILDSYGAGSGGRGRMQQLAWLKEDLAANRQPWTIVALHVPMVATRRSLNWFGDGDFLPVLEEHEVDIVFSGHHPHYRRYHPIGTQGKRPILHVTSGGGGGPVGGSMPSPLLARGIDVNHYCRIDVEPGRLTLTAQAISGAVIDRFEIVKDAAPAPDAEATITADTPVAKEVISLYQELLTDRTYELHLQTGPAAEAGQQAELVLDLSKLPRGPLKPELRSDDLILVLESTEDSPWKIERQEASLSGGRLKFRATSPEKLDVGATEIRPKANVRLRLKRGEQVFQPYETTARLMVIPSSE